MTFLIIVTVIIGIVGGICELVGSNWYEFNPIEKWNGLWLIKFGGILLIITGYLQTIALMIYVSKTWRFINWLDLVYIGFSVALVFGGLWVRHWAEEEERK